MLRKNNKFLSFALVMILIVGIIGFLPFALGNNKQIIGGVSYEESNKFIIIKDGVPIDWDKSVYGDVVFTDGSTLIPARIIAERFGMDVGWENDTKTATISKNGTTFAFKIGDKFCVNRSNGAKGEFNVPAILFKTLGGENRTYIPLRGFGENLGFTVNYHHYGSQYSPEFPSENHIIEFKDKNYREPSISGSPTHDSEGYRYLEILPDPESPEHAVGPVVTENVDMGDYIMYSERFSKNPYKRIVLISKSGKMVDFEDNGWDNYDVIREDGSNVEDFDSSKPSSPFYHQSSDQIVKNLKNKYKSKSNTNYYYQAGRVARDGGLNSYDWKNDKVGVEFGRKALKITIFDFKYQIVKDVIKDAVIVFFQDDKDAADKMNDIIFNDLINGVSWDDPIMFKWNTLKEGVQYKLDYRWEQMWYPNNRKTGEPGKKEAYPMGTITIKLDKFWH